MLFNIITVVILIVCVLLILIVLVQNSKGGGLASSFAASNQIVGVRKTADFLEKATWTLVIALLGLSLLSSMTRGTSEDNAPKSVIQDQVDNSTNLSQPTALPILDDQPAQEQGGEAQPQN
ncbi:MAG: preprotein translocase subunit SecG [Flavobacteriales bacterium]|nr:preprotein translocase subunit SecG [Flavobacteriales bacterium]MCB9449435.1 preprotein translocase subunit SecG [Flavobacteriales bacterium]